MTNIRTLGSKMLLALVVSGAIVVPNLPVAAPAHAASYAFTRNLAVGAQGEDVRQLQVLLNAARTRIAASGAGSPGMESTYFGALTKAAVVRFQNLYASDVLVPAGLSSGNGFVGTLTRAKLMSLEAGTPTTPTTPNNPAPTSTPVTEREGDFREFKVLSAPSNEHVSENEAEPVLGFSFKADDSDLTMDRVDLRVAATGTVLSDKPWTYVNSIALYDDENMTHRVARVSAGSRSNWSSDNDGYTIRMSGIGARVAENATGRFFVGVTVKKNVKSSLLPQQFVINLADRGVRATDTKKIQHYAGSASAAKMFTVEQPTTAVVEVRSDVVVEDRLVQVDENAKTTEQQVLSFGLRGKGAASTVEELTLNVNATGTQASTAVRSVRLAWDGGSRTASVNGTTVTFDDLDLDLDKDETVDVKVYATLNGTNRGARYAEGSSVQFTVAGADIEASDRQDDDAAGSGATDSGTLTLASSGVTTSLVSTKSAMMTAGDKAIGTNTITFTVRAFGKDMYIPMTASSSDAGAEWSIIGDTFTGSVASTLTSTARISGSDYVVKAGSSATFTLSVSLDNEGGTPGFYAAKLERLRFDSAPHASPAEYRSVTGGFTTFRTDPVYLF